MASKSKTFLPISFSELGEKKKSALVAEKILGAIQSGKLTPGAKLPSEREISEQMNVSRTIIREALSALRIVGAVTVRTGEGTYISDQSDRVSPLHRTVTLLEQSESPLEIWEARQALEKTAGEMALAKATNRDDKMFVEIYEDMVEKGRQGDVDRHLLSNRQFHWLFFKVADNSILTRIGMWLMDFTDQLITRDATNQYLGKGLEQSLAIHREILDAFLNRDLTAFNRGIDHHFSVLERFYSEEYE